MEQQDIVAQRVDATLERVGIETAIDRFKEHLTDDQIDEVLEAKGQEEIGLQPEGFAEALAYAFKESRNFVGFQFRAGNTAEEYRSAIYAPTLAQAEAILNETVDMNRYTALEQSRSGSVDPETLANHIVGKYKTVEAFKEQLAKVAHLEKDLTPGNGRVGGR
jgi:hypothetical protein